MLEAKNIHKIYNDGKKRIHVLKGINLKVEAVDFLAIVGPSGAGKSTLLHILGGLDNPTEGKIFFEGNDLYQMDDDLLCKLRNSKIGFVFQFYHLLSEFTVLENVLIPALISNSSSSKQATKRQAALKLLNQLGLGERINHFPNQLSGGEQQRVAIARALINKPTLLLCDEPTGNLDSTNGRYILNLLRELNNQENLTIILVTHDQEIAQMAKRIVHLRDGMILD